MTGLKRYVQDTKLLFFVFCIFAECKAQAILEVSRPIVLLLKLSFLKKRHVCVTEEERLFLNYMYIIFNSIFAMTSCILQLHQLIEAVTLQTFFSIDVCKQLLISS